MGFKKTTKASADQPEPSKLIRSQFKDVMVKVEDDVYYLDRLPLALKSGHFKKLFAEGESDLIEIPRMDSKTFSAAVDIMYGETLKSVMVGNTINNFVSLLTVMDYLQMDTDTETYKSFVTEELDSSRPFNKDIFKLYNFIVDGPGI
ncbi:uncharacterized protein LOC135847612 [Planococcus citri]|uniref:uncharacterized protein LOC135847612 n=1 Tax=Planococcus citri TaxID=170843 RepID=UPI0031F7312C